MKAIIALILLSLSLGGCALFAAGIVGAVIENDYRHHRQGWCAYHTFDPNCRTYWWGHYR